MKVSFSVNSSKIKDMARVSWSHRGKCSRDNIKMMKKHMDAKETLMEFTKGSLSME